MSDKFRDLSSGEAVIYVTYDYGNLTRQIPATFVSMTEHRCKIQLKNGGYRYVKRTSIRKVSP